MSFMKSPKEISTEKKIISSIEDIISKYDDLDSVPLEIARLLIDDEEMQAAQD